MDELLEFLNSECDELSSELSRTLDDNGKNLDSVIEKMARVSVAIDWTANFLKINDETFQALKSKRALDLLANSPLVVTASYNSGDEN